MLRKFWAIFRGLMMELTDQAAYQRHLAAHGLVHSGETWRHFSDHKWNASAKRPKCC